LDKSHRRLFSLSIALNLLVIGALARAQSNVFDPRIVEFAPSVDHAATTTDGQPVVARYDLEFYNIGATQPFQTLDLGKPGSGADGLVRVDFTTLLVAWPLPGTPYEARVAAVGPGGAGRSAVSNSFTFTSQCAATIDPPNAAVHGGASSGTLSVQAPDGCAWSAIGSAEWIVVDTASGSGPGTVSYNVAANAQSEPRAAAIAVAGRQFDVAQSAVCTYTASPATVAIPAAGGTDTVSVATGSGCPWSAASSDPWISIAAGGAGAGPGTVTIQAATNASGSARSGTVTIAGATVAVTQAGMTAPSPPTTVRVIR
jgi:hypothetical protein